MICPNCGKQGVKVIASAMPMKLCTTCYTLWGFWSDIYTFLVAPIEGMFNDGFAFMIYEGSYLGALWDWVRGDADEE